MKEINVNGLKCQCVKPQNFDAITYILYPMDSLSGWITPAAEKFKTAIVVITGMDWDNDLTPWPAVGVPKGCPDFKGNAQEFLKKLIDTVTAIDTQLSISSGTVHNLIGVSLSGLFTLWQWTQCNLFENIACLSGSFWYDGFVEWFDNQPLIGPTDKQVQSERTNKQTQSDKTDMRNPSDEAGNHDLTVKTGLAFFLLGDKESQTHIKAFQPVAVNTAAIVQRLKSEGIRAEFQSVPGNHYQHPLPRLTLALSKLQL